MLITIPTSNKDTGKWSIPSQNEILGGGGEDIILRKIHVIEDTKYLSSSNHFEIKKVFFTPIPTIWGVFMGDVQFLPINRKNTPQMFKTLVI